MNKFNQDQHENLKKQLIIYIQELQEAGKVIAKGLLRDLTKKGAITEDEAKQIALDLKI